MESTVYQATAADRAFENYFRQRRTRKALAMCYRRRAIRDNT